MYIYLTCLQGAELQLLLLERMVALHGVTKWLGEAAAPGGK